MSKLLQEAIADAKAVRETALANARLALEEAFAPRLQSMLTKKLREDEELHAEEPEEENAEEVEETEEIEVSDESDEEVEPIEDTEEVEEGSYYEDDEDSVEDEIEDEL